MASEWDGFLEALAEAYIADQGYEQAEFPNLSRVADKLLKERLKPLLEAGQAMRKYAGGYHEKDMLAVNPNCEQCTAILGYDVAREAALKGSR